MRATVPLTCLIIAALPLGACSRNHRVHDVQAMQAWVAACEDEPTDESALEKIAATYALEQFSLAEIGGLKQHAARDAGAQADGERPYISTVEAWWIDPNIGSYVEVVEWTRTMHKSSEIVSKTYRTCLARGYSQSREGFAQEVHLDPTAGYGFRTTADKTLAWMGTVDGAHPEFYVDFAKNGTSATSGRLNTAATENVSLSTGLKRVTQTVGWPARWSFAASGDVR